MLKIFLRLWILVFLPLGYLIFSTSYNPIHAVNRMVLHDRIEQTYQGTFYLIEQQLLRFPESEWHLAFQSIENEFGHELRLIPESDDIAGQRHLDALLPGEFLIFSDDFGTDVVVRRVEATQWFIYMLLDASEDQQTLAQAQGTMNLWLKSFMEAPQEKWPSIVEQLSAHFGFALNLRAMNELEIPKNKMSQLKELGRTWITNEQNETLVFLSLPESDLTLVGGPIPLPGDELSVLAAIVSIFIGGVSLGILIFVFPLWRDLKKLAKTAELFGKGHLETRSPIRGRSVIGGLSNSFNSMADQIEKMVQGQRDLTNAIAHDLRTPLSRLGFAFEMLEDEDTVSLDEKARYKKSIASGIDTLDHLIQQILTFSRYSRAANIAQFGSCNLWQTLSDEVEELGREHRNVQIELQMAPELLSDILKVDQRALLRALNNLVSNALRFSKGRIRIGFSKSDQRNQLVVEDDGTGIPKSQRANVFIPFKQLNNEQRESSKHYGLGLAIVKQIAELHQGEILVSESDLGGARFEFSWPDFQS